MWMQARNNMPRTRHGVTGSPKLLRQLLGYSVKDRGSHALHFSTCVVNGTKPLGVRAQLLEQLAGPYGTVLVKVIAAKRNLDLSRYNYWPDGKGGFNAVCTMAKGDNLHR
jgi:hypothetical protein